MKKNILDNIHENVPANYYQKGIKDNNFQHFWHTKRFIEVTRMIDDYKPQKMLDIGCHSGKFTYEISKKIPKTKMYGIDISKEAIEYAKKNYKKISFKVARAEKLPFRNDAFDFITCLEVMEHIENPTLVLKEIKRVVKKSGQIIVLVPSESLLFKIIWFGWIHLGPGKVWNHTHINQFTNHSLDNLLKKGGFKVKKRKLFLLRMLLLIQAEKL